MPIIQPSMKKPVRRKKKPVPLNYEQRIAKANVKPVGGITLAEAARDALHTAAIEQNIVAREISEELERLALLGAKARADSESAVETAQRLHGLIS